MGQASTHSSCNTNPVQMPVGKVQGACSGQGALIHPAVCLWWAGMCPSWPQTQPAPRLCPLLPAACRSFLSQSSAPAAALPRVCARGLLCIGCVCAVLCPGRGAQEAPHHHQLAAPHITCHAGGAWHSSAGPTDLQHGQEPWLAEQQGANSRSSAPAHSCCCSEACSACAKGCAGTAKGAANCTQHLMIPITGTYPHPTGAPGAGPGT